MQHIVSVNSSIKEERRLGTGHKIPLSFYMDPPTEELTLDEFELLSLDRLQLLRSIEMLKTRGFEDLEFNRKVQEVSPH